MFISRIFLLHHGIFSMWIFRLPSILHKGFLIDIYLFISISYSALTPGQPVVDLQSYMDALNKKNVAVSKMVATLEGSKSDPATQMWNPYFSLEKGT